MAPPDLNVGVRKKFQEEIVSKTVIQVDGGRAPPAEGTMCAGLHRAYKGERGRPGVLDKQGVGAPSLGGCKVRKCFFAAKSEMIFCSLPSRTKKV